MTFFERQGDLFDGYIERVYEYVSENNPCLFRYRLNIG